eukprot:scaffold3876_cov344-Prasinococcus_capsulatus_cf.AAC.6
MTPWAQTRHRCLLSPRSCLVFSKTSQDIAAEGASCRRTWPSSAHTLPSNGPGLLHPAEGTTHLEEVWQQALVQAREPLRPHRFTASVHEATPSSNQSERIRHQLAHAGAAGTQEKHSPGGRLGVVHAHVLELERLVQRDLHGRVGDYPKQARGNPPVEAAHALLRQHSLGCVEHTGVHAWRRGCQSGLEHVQRINRRLRHNAPRGPGQQPLLGGDATVLICQLVLEYVVRVQLQAQLWSYLEHIGAVTPKEGREQAAL